MSQQKFPPGWDEQRVREVLPHYEDQSEDEQFAESKPHTKRRGRRLWPCPRNWRLRFVRDRP